MRITDSALVAAANLSNRYIADRFLPDKAIDLVDEAASRLAMEKESVPEPIDHVQRRLRQLELAHRQLVDEQGRIGAGKSAKRSKKKWKSLNRELASLREQWEAEKMGLDDVQSIRQEAEELQHRFATFDAEAKQKQLRGESPEDLYREMLDIRTRQSELERRLEEFEHASKRQRRSSQNRPTTNAGCCVAM